MNIIEDLSKTQILANVASLGFFDGVHLGHQSLLRQLNKEAKSRKLPSLVITFQEHPRRVFQADYQPQLLTTLNEKLCRLAQCHPDYCYVLPFDREMSHLTYQEFMKTWLKDTLRVNTLVVGYDHHFGSNRNSCFEDYKAFGEKIGIEVVQAEEYKGFEEGQSATIDSVSSSTIRFALQVGDVEKAESLLGYEYCLDGTVVSGDHLGQRFGFPTANLDPVAIHKMLPMDGAYAVKVEIEGETYAGMAYIGRRPTVLHDGPHTVEVHILHFAEDIYDKPMHIDFVRRLRADKHFDSVQALTAQLQRDLEKTDKMAELQSLPTGQKPEVIE